MKRVKKLISALMALVMILSLAVPAFAADSSEKEMRRNIPLVRISGDGEALYNKDGKKVLHYRDLLSGKKDDEDDDKSGIYQSVANVLLPFLIEGLIFDKWDNYYTNLQKKIGELFGETLLDKNGEASNGTNISQATLNQVQYDMTHNKADRNGNYGLFDYYYKYDWRLDPMESADKFNEYIKSVKKATGAEKVGIMASCLGSSVTLAYIAKYGTDDICGVGMDAPTSNGAEILSETVSGKFKVDIDAINRFLADCDGFGFFSVSEFINATVDLVSKSGVVDIHKEAFKEKLYYKLVEGVTSALALSTFYTWPNYWSCVAADDYQEAINYVFGPEGSEKRTEYAGLIEKLDNYDKNVRQRLPEIYNQIKADGANLGIIAKYGCQIAPACESRNEIGDQLISVNHASLGATTAKIYGTLSDEYIADRVAEGKGKYISPDKQVDASTCQFPDYTWFVKGTTHSDWTGAENQTLWRVVTAKEQVTVDDTELSQFMVWDKNANAMVKMTEDNCNTYFWNQDNSYTKPETPAQKLLAFITSIFTWLRLLLEKIWK